MSVHNTEVHRCKDCNGVVVIVPEGFSVAQEELDTKAKDHQAECPVVLERMLEMTEVGTEAPPAPVETWRKWTDEDRAKQPRRECSVAGCKGKPAQMKETVTQRKDGTPTRRRHVYCETHTPAVE